MKHLFLALSLPLAAFSLYAEVPPATPETVVTPEVQSEQQILASQIPAQQTTPQQVATQQTPAQKKTLLETLKERARTVTTNPKTQAAIQTAREKAAESDLIKKGTEKAGSLLGKAKDFFGIK